VAPSIGQVAATSHEPLLLELVEQQHDIVRIHAKRLGELLLRATIMIAHIAEGHQMAHVHAEQLFRAAPINLLGQTREQGHRARTACPLSTHSA